MHTWDRTAKHHQNMEVVEILLVQQSLMKYTDGSWSLAQIIEGKGRHYCLAIQGTTLIGCTCDGNRLSMVFQKPKPKQPNAITLSFSAQSRFYKDHILPQDYHTAFLMVSGSESEYWIYDGDTLLRQDLVLGDPVPNTNILDPQVLKVYLSTMQGITKSSIRKSKLISNALLSIPGFHYATVSELLHAAHLHPKTPIMKIKPAHIDIFIETLQKIYDCGGMITSKASGHRPVGFDGEGAYHPSVYGRRTTTDGYTIHHQNYLYWSSETVL